MARIVLGIPCYDMVPPEVLEDYMRFSYNLGRRITEHDFFLAIKTKSEQYRARNAIVEAALRIGADYLLFLDDDHIIDWEGGNDVSERYNFVRTLVKHLEADPKRGIVGCLYYHRGGDCNNVLMKEGKDGGFYYLRDDEIKNELQEVAVQGGGCMLINTNIFSVIQQPWFQPESVAGIGTDLQICQNARKHGFSVFSDTSIVLGHVLQKREVVTPKSRARIIGDHGAVEATIRGIDPKWTANAALQLYQQDGEEYLQLSVEEIFDLAMSYAAKNMTRFKDYDNTVDYYKSLGPEQLARQLWFHNIPDRLQEHENFWNMLDSTKEFYGLDYGCGSAPIGFEMVLRGHRLDFVDIDGTPAYEFTKWRAKHRRVEDRCGWDLGGPYDYVLMMDSIEHIPDWREMLEGVIERMKPDASLVTNYFFNTDFANIEHVSMEHFKVQQFLTEHKIFPLNHMIWIKRDIDFMTQQSNAA